MFSLRRHLHARPPGRNPPAGQPVVHSAHVLPRAIANVSPATGAASRAAGFPGARHPVLVHPGAALCRRGRRLDARAASWTSPTRRFRPARARLCRARVRAEYFRRRVLRFPFWQQALQVAVLLLFCAAAGAARARDGRRAAAALDLRSCRRSSARCSGRSLSVVLQWPQRPTRSPANASLRRTTACHGATLLVAPHGSARPRVRRARAAQCRARALPLPPPARARRRARRRAPSAGCRALRLPAGRPARRTTRRWPRPTASRSCRSCPTAASSPTATAWCWRRATRRTRSRSRRRAIKNLDATIDELAEIVDIQPRDRKRFRKLLEESKNFESLPLRTRLSDEEVARFAVNRYRFPGVEIKARLFRQYPYGEVASHVIGYIGRINDRDVERIAEWDETRQLQGLRLHRQDRRRALLRARTARHDRRRGSRGRRRRPRGAHAVAHAAGRPATTCALSLDIKLQQAAEAAFGDHRGALVAIEPVTGDVLAFVSQAGLRSQPVRRRHRPGELGRAQQLARQAAAQPAAARRLSARLDDQAVPRAGRADVGQAHAAADDLRSRLLPARRPSHRFRDDKPGGHGSVDMYKSIVVSCDTYYYMLGERDGHRRHRALHVAARLRQQDRHRHRGRARPACCPRGSGSASASPARSTARSTASGISATRSRPASARATTRSRRCSWRRRSPRSPTTASRSGRTWSRTSRTSKTGEERAVAPRADAHDPGRSRSTSRSSATRWSA